MNQFSLLQFIAAPLFKKQFLRRSMLLLFTIPVGLYAGAQCNNTTLSGIVTAPLPGNTLQINACANAGEYSVINSVAASTSYTVTSSTTTDLFTIRSGTANGPVVGYGLTPLTWTSGSAGTYYVHINTPVCGSQATCRTTSIAANSSCGFFPVTVSPGNTCGGTITGSCVPLTASGADTYTWYPFEGLYYDCQHTAPYTGGNTSLVYAAPLFYTAYTVTGKITATGCTNTAIASVNATPYRPTVTPPSVNMCMSDQPVKLRITSPGTMQFCSGAVNIPVPDNNAAGVSNSVFVSGIMPACNMMNISVTINMTHTRVGDMVFVLKAPNGNVLNLDYHISTTGGSGSTSGFINTVIASHGSATLSSGTNPYTDTFKADAQGGPAGGYGPSGPTGMAATTISWSDLYAVPNGTWTLGMYDGVGSESGILNSWCLNIYESCATTGSPNTTPGVWSPAAGLFFDGAGTMPYIAGTAIDSVWAKPQPAGVYTYQVTTQSLPPALPSCTSDPRSVVVTVGQQTTITTQPVSQNICVGNNAIFSVVATGTSPLSYQWQESANGISGPYVNIVNVLPYSGVNTAALTINTPTVSMNGYSYKVIIYGGSSCGGIISAPAILTVNPLPAVVISANPLIVLPGMPTTIYSTVLPNPAATYTWYHNGNIVAGAIADSLVVDINGLGDYQLRVTDINGCSNLSNIITITDHFASNLFVYPNPTGGQFQARYYNEANTVSPRSLIVYNSRGEKVVTKSFTQTISYERIDVDIRPYGKGFYWVELIDEKGKRLAINRVVVQ